MYPTIFSRFYKQFSLSRYYPNDSSKMSHCVFRGVIKHRKSTVDWLNFTHSSKLRRTQTFFVNHMKGKSLMHNVAWLMCWLEMTHYKNFWEFWLRNLRSVATYAEPSVSISVVLNFYPDETWDRSFQRR